MGGTWCVVGGVPRLNLGAKGGDIVPAEQHPMLVER